MSDGSRVIAVAILHASDRWKIHWVRVTPFEGLCRFWAQSEKGRATRYLVDLDYWWGIGNCACEDFGINKEPIISRWKAEEREITDAWRCKHCIACRMFLGTDLLDRVLAQRRHEANKTR